MAENQHLLRQRPVIRVFVSSPFVDLKHERDALQRDVFLKLEEHCAKRQFQFQAIDLRWGVPAEATHHRALDDARNILHILSVLTNGDLSQVFL